MNCIKLINRTCPVGYKSPVIILCSVFIAVMFSATTIVAQKAIADKRFTDYLETNPAQAGIKFYVLLNANAACRYCHKLTLDAFVQNKRMYSQVQIISYDGLFREIPDIDTTKLHYQLLPPKWFNTLGYLRYRNALLELTPHKELLLHLNVTPKNVDSIQIIVAEGHK